MNRRDLLKGAVAVIPGALAIDLLTVRPAVAQETALATPVDVLNYALVLEYLEDEYYRQAIASGVLAGVEAAWVARIGQDETAHVAALTRAVSDLGGTPVPQPAVDFGHALASRQTLLATALRFENACLQGYLGAGPALFRSAEIRQAALGIYGVEARHAALLGLMAGSPAAGGVFRGPLEAPLAPAQVLHEIGGFLADPAAVTGRAAVTR